MKLNDNFSEYKLSYKSKLILGDSLHVMSKMRDNTYDLIVADPPYFLSNNGITCNSGKMVSVNKGSWDKESSNSYFFNEYWCLECKRILKDGGAMWIFGTMHNIYDIGSIIKNTKGLKILNNITWVKKAPPPNLSCRYFTHSTETILWVRKGVKSKHYFNYELMKSFNDNKQMKDVWVLGRPLKKEKEFGKHPTQKPEELITRIIQSSTKKYDSVLDPFCGSGTVGAVCAKEYRKFTGIDNDSKFINLSKKRLKKLL